MSLECSVCVGTSSVAVAIGRPYEVACGVVNWGLWTVLTGA